MRRFFSVALALASALFLGLLGNTISFGLLGNTTFFGLLRNAISQMIIVSEAAAADEHFVRVRRDDNGNPSALETSVAHYEGKTTAGVPFSVDLVSAVHVGEGTYYALLNERFKGYDAVLYELIAPHQYNPGALKQGGSQSPVSIIQLAIRDFLKLEFQLERVDYGKPNFVHADMSPEEFFSSMEKRDESFLKMFMRALAFGYAKEARGEVKPPDLAVLLLMFNQSRAIALRRMIAGEFESMGELLEALNGPEGSTLVSERNKVALKVLDQELKRGKSKFAIFYGGAHMPDIEQRLGKAYGLKLTHEEWLIAWDLAL